MLSFRPSLRLFAAATLACLAACDDRAPSAPPRGITPSGLAVVSGDGQLGIAGAPLRDEIAVAVVHPAAGPLAGVPVQFAVVSGGGQLSAQTATSDERGIARVRWTLGPVAADSQVIEARLEPPLTVTLRLRAYASADAPAAVAVVAGNGASGQVGGVLADSLAVSVKDRLGNPVVGLEVAWEVAAGGGELSPARAVTGVGGVARAAWTLGPRVDSAQVALARVPGLSPVAFTVHAVTAGVPLQLAKRGGDGQRGTAGGLLADSLGVVLRMPDGRPVVGATVRWSAPPGAGVVTPAVSRTDANGAAAAVWRLGIVRGLVQATAAVDSGTLVFTALTGADAPAQAAFVAGGGEGPVGAALADSLAVRVTDQYGNLVPGAEVDWLAVSGGGSLHPARSATDDEGVARTQWTLGPRVDSVQVAQARVAGLDPVAFTARAATAGAPLQLAKRLGDGQRGPAGTLLADSLGVVLRMPDGRPVAGALVRWSAPAGAGTVAPAESRTDANGAASAVWRLGTAAGLAQVTATVDEGTLIFTALVQAAAPARIVAAGGGGGEGPVGGFLADSLAVRVTDAYGNPVPGAEVGWSADAGGSMEPARGTTDADGVARARWMLGTRVDSAHVAQARVAGLDPVSFTARATTAGVPLELVRHGLTNQNATTGSSLYPTVRLRLPDGRGVSGAIVRWSAEPGAGSVSPAESRTDANGVASTRWRVGSRPGMMEVTAQAYGGWIIFFANVVEAVPAKLEIVAGDGATGGVGQPLADLLAVRVTDAQGNPVPGVGVTWRALPGSGSVAAQASVTDTLGISRARWWLGMRVGEPAQKVTAGVSSLLVEFHATGTIEGVPVQLVRVAGEGQTGYPGIMLDDSLSVQLRTQAGAPIEGASIAWTVLSGGGQLSPASVRTSAQGHARAAWTMGSTAGPASASAAVQNSTVVFTATTRSVIPAAMQIVRGDGQSATRGMALPDSLVVLVTDASGAPLGDVRVNWSVVSGAGHLEHPVSTTGADGRARNRWAVGFTPGSNSARASTQAGPAALFSATGQEGELELRGRSTARVAARVGRHHESLTGIVEAYVTDSLGRRAVNPPLQWVVPSEFPAPGWSPSQAWPELSTISLHGYVYNHLFTLVVIVRFEDQSLKLFELEPALPDQLRQ